MFWKIWNIIREMLFKKEEKTKNKKESKRKKYMYSNKLVNKKIEFPEDKAFKKNKWNELRGCTSAPLDNRQEQFVMEYLKDYNKKRAAIKAGYPKQTAHANATVLLSSAKINKAIKKRREKSVESV